MKRSAFVPGKPIIKQVASNKSSLLLNVSLQNNQSLRLKIFTKVIKRPSKEPWVSDTESLIKREARAL